MIYWNAKRKNSVDSQVPPQSNKIFLLKLPSILTGIKMQILRRTRSLYLNSALVKKIYWFNDSLLNFFEYFFWNARRFAWRLLDCSSEIFWRSSVQKKHVSGLSWISDTYKPRICMYFLYCNENFSVSLKISECSENWNLSNDEKFETLLKAWEFLK